MHRKPDTAERLLLRLAQKKSQRAAHQPLVPAEEWEPSSPPELLVEQHEINNGPDHQAVSFDLSSLPPWDILTGRQVNCRPYEFTATVHFSYVNGHVIIPISCEITGGDLWFCPIGSEVEEVEEEYHVFPAATLWLICGFITVVAVWLSDAAATWRIICGKSIMPAVITFSSQPLFSFLLNEWMLPTC